MKLSTSVDTIQPKDLELVERNIQKTILSSTKWRSFRSEVLASYNPVSGNRLKLEDLRLGTMSKKDFIILCLVTQYEESILQYLLKVVLSEKLEKLWGLEDLSLLLEENFFYFISSSTRFNRRYLLGLFSEKELAEFLKRFQFKVLYPKTSKPKKVLRHKGYRDKGTLPDESTIARREEVQNEASFTLQQNLREEYQQNINLFLEVHRSYLKSKEPSTDKKLQRRTIYVFTGKNQLKQADFRKSEEQEIEYRKADLHSGEKDFQPGECTSEPEISNYLRRLRK